MGRIATAAAVLISVFSFRDAQASLVYQSELRQVYAAITHPLGADTQQEDAGGFAPFDASVAAQYAAPTGPGTATASQQSWLGPFGFSVTGGTSIQNPFYAHEPATYQTRSTFDIAFSVDSPIDFSLTAKLEGLWDTGGTNIDGGQFTMQFSGPGGIILAESITAPGRMTPGGGFDPPIEYDIAGTLSPGLYQFHVEFLDNLDAVGSLDDPPFSIGVGGGGSAEFSLVLLVPEPACLGWLWLVLLGAYRRGRPARGMGSSN